MRAVYIVSASGLLLCAQALTPAVDTDGARLHGALITALARLATQVTGGALRLLEFSHLTIYLALPADSPAGVVFILDPAHGAPRDAVLAFSSRLASTLLTSFLDEHHASLIAGARAHALGAYREWGLRLPAICLDATRAALQALALLPSVDSAALASDDGAWAESFASPDASPGRGREMDDGAGGATLRPLLGAASELLAATTGDAVTTLSLLAEPRADARVLAWQLDGATLVLHGRARALTTAAVLAAPGALWLVTQRLCATAQRARRQLAPVVGGAGVATAAAPGALGSGGCGAGGLALVADTGDIL